MYFLNMGFLGDESTCSNTPTQAAPIQYVELKNGWFDDLYLSKETHSEPTNLCPADWDFDTCLYATFDGNTNAGNIDLNLQTISHLVIKRRKADEFLWITLYSQEVNTEKDFAIQNVDYTNAGNTDYIYACVPVFYGVEHSYLSTPVSSRLSGIFLAEKDAIYGTNITDGFCDTTRNIPSTVTPILNSKYPIYLSNTIANFDTGTFTGGFTEFHEETCDYQFDSTVRIPFQRQIMEFLSNRKPKLLKHFDGRIWLVMITGNPADTADSSYDNRKISFEWTEIGDYRSEEDLYYANLSDITEEWWNK